MFYVWHGNSFLCLIWQVLLRKFAEHSAQQVSAISSQNLTFIHSSLSLNKQLHNRALSIVVPEQLHNWAGFQYCVVIVWQLNKYHLLRSALVTFANVFEFLLICGMNHSFKAKWFQRGQLTSNLGCKHCKGTKLFWKPKFGFNQRCSLKALKKEKVVL